MGLWRRFICDVVILFRYQNGGPFDLWGGRGGGEGGGGVKELFLCNSFPFSIFVKNSFLARNFF